ncbi:hypothetical protein DXV76_04220 [Rhodobacteraceae bacterium CCMM004]|nr:hypothetical protein DXV76_04220 [Rhodobacteraceae bacterium CCMM004]
MAQIVMIKWGDRYPAAYVNGLARAVREHSRTAHRLICYTDDPTDIQEGVDTRPFPDLGTPLSELTARTGSLPKMSMFLRGQLDPGEPALYLDLDTSIHGDVERLADLVRRTGAVYLLQRHVVPYWRVRGLVNRVLPHRYYLGNTAIMAFRPQDTWQIGELFLTSYRDWAADPNSVDPFVARLFEGGNESIVSAMVRDRSRVFPRNLAVKFTQEYMAPTAAWAEWKTAQPGTQVRRREQVAVTYHGDPLKPEILARMEEGQRLSFKHHHTVWRFPKISAYWRDVLGE